MFVSLLEAVGRSSGSCSKGVCHNAAACERSYAYLVLYSGGFDFNGTVPITGATGTYSVPVFSYYHSLSFFGRSANVTVSLPYGVGTFTGDVSGKDKSVYRSGLLDLSARFSVNLKGEPAMAPKEFVKWKQKTIIGASLKMVAPTGQYDPEPNR